MTDEPATEGNEEALPEDSGKVDLSNLADAEREVIGRRIGTLYGTTKELRKTLDEMAKANRVLFEKVQGIEQRGAESERERILADITAASEEGDGEKVATLTDRLTRLNSNGSKDDSASGSDPGESPKEEKNEDTFDLSEHLSPTDEAKLVAWAKEADGEGNPLRPWLQENHPKYARAMRVAQSVMGDKSLTPTDMLKEIDEIMGVSRPQAPSTVLSPSGPTRTGTPQKPKATPEQKTAAEAMGVKLEDYMSIVAASETYPDGTMVKIVELED